MRETAKTKKIVGGQRNAFGPKARVAAVSVKHHAVGVFFCDIALELTAN
jgi:hypothetical protein